MVGGTSFHREILKASCSRVSNGKIKILLISKTGKRVQHPHNRNAEIRHSTCLLTTPTRL